MAGVVLFHQITYLYYNQTYHYVTERINRIFRDVNQDSAPISCLFPRINHPKFKLRIGNQPACLNQDSLTAVRLGGTSHGVGDRISNPQLWSKARTAVKSLFLALGLKRSGVRPAPTVHHRFEKFSVEISAAGEKHARSLPAGHRP